jgi:hypothetical protein
MPADLDHILREFLDEWKDDRREGRTMKVLHDNVKDLDTKLDDHLADYQKRVTTLETNQARDAEGRTFGAGGTGRFQVVPPQHQQQESITPHGVTLRTPNPKPPQSWWAKSPTKEAIGYGAAALVAGGIGLATGHQIAIPMPAAPRRRVRASTRDDRAHDRDRDGYYLSDAGRRGRRQASLVRLLAPRSRAGCASGSRSWSL